MCMYVQISDPIVRHALHREEASLDSYSFRGSGMTTHQMASSKRRPHRMPMVPAGARIVWTIARATKAPRKDDMMPAKRMSREGTRRGEARQGSPNSSTS